MSYQLGIDVGTTYTAAAVCRSAGRRWVEPEVVTLGTRGATVPSVLFIAPDETVVVGEAAERRALTDPDRVVREFKRRIGDPTPIVVGGRAWAPEELSARLVRWVVDRVAEREGGQASQIALTHPASWGSHKKDLLTAALAAQGLRVSLLAEPQAAALHYATQERVTPGSTIAVYDLGGGTFDAAVVRKADRSEVAFGAAGFGLLGRPEGLDRLGGVDFDEVVFEHVRAGLPVAFTDLDDTDTGVLSAVARVRRECTEAKEALSADTDVSIPVLLPAGGGSVRLHRSEFESMIRPQVEETVDALRTAVRSAGCRPDELSAVLLVGGSSRIPLVAQLVSEGLARPVAVDTDPKNAIAKGAALSVSPVPTASWPEVAIPPVPAGVGRDGDGPVAGLGGAGAGMAAGGRGAGAAGGVGTAGAIAAGAGMAASVGAGRVAVDDGSRGAGRHAAPEADARPMAQVGLADEPTRGLLNREPARPAVHPVPTPVDWDPAPEPARPRSVGLIVGVGLLAVIVIVLVALLVPRMTSSEPPAIVTESGASSPAATSSPSAAPVAPAQGSVASGGSGPVGGSGARQGQANRQRSSGGGAVAPSNNPPPPAAVQQPSAQAATPATTAPAVPPSAPAPAPAPATEAPAPTSNTSNGALGGSTPAAGDTATPVGGVGSTGSNTPVGTGGHHGGEHPGPGSSPSAEAPTGVSATGSAPATAETSAA